MKKHLCLFLFILGFSFWGKSAEVFVVISKVENSHLVQYNFDATKYEAYHSALQDSIASFFADWNIEQSVKITETLDPDLRPYYAFTAKPALPDSTRHALLKKMMQVSPIISKHLPFSTELIVTINGGCKDRSLDFTPILKSPLELRQRVYEYGDLEQNFHLMRKWVSRHGIPILLDVLKEEGKSDPATQTFHSIFSTTYANQEIKLQPFVVKEDMSYWSALRVSEEYETLLPSLKVMQLVLEGRVTYAQLYIQMICQFESSESLIRYVLDELIWRINYCYKEEQEIIHQVQQSKDEEVKMELLDSILQINPMNEAALNELFRITDGVEYVIYPWEKELRNFSISNPMRTFTLTPISKKEAYFNHLRLSTEDLFIDAETFHSDFPKLANIALKLEVYDFATDLYWMLYHNSIIDLSLDGESLSENDDKVKEYQSKYKYALYKVGVIEGFDRKTKKKFKRLEKRTRKKMKHSSAYKNFNN